MSESDFSRRDFLKSGLAGSAALILPAAVSTLARAAVAVPSPRPDMSSHRNLFNGDCNFLFYNPELWQPEGGTYRVRVSLTRICLWLIAMGIFDKDFAKTTAGRGDEHSLVDPDLFTAETPLGTYQGMTEQIGFSSLKTGYRTVLAPMGSSKPERLQHWNSP